MYYYEDVVTTTIWDLCNTRNIQKPSFNKEITGRTVGYGTGFSHALNSLSSKNDSDPSIVRLKKSGTQKHISIRSSHQISDDVSLPGLKLGSVRNFLNKEPGH